MRNSSLAAVFLIVSVLSSVSWSLAQTPVPATDTKELTDTATLHLIVTDNKDHAIDSLRREDVQILEDGKPQELVAFERVEGPLKYAIVIDASLSFKRLIAPALQAATAIVSRNQPQDSTLLVRFVSSDKIETLENFTSDTTRLSNALKSLRTEMGQSAIIDALYLTAAALAKNNDSGHGRRRAVVLISDGEDRHSYYNLDQLIKLLNEQNIQVFAVGIVGELDSESGFIKPSQRDQAMALLTRLARETGGRVFFPQDTRTLQEAAQEIAHDLHSEFLLGYTLPQSSKAGVHKVQVKIVNAGKDRLTAITRPTRGIKADKTSTQKKEKQNP
jgi:Ca-activated chloride channel family protein